MRSREFKVLTGDLARAGALTEPRCQHAVECGGCAFQDREYADQAKAKAEVLNRLWQSSDPERAIYNLDTPISLVASPEAYEYRTRMDYVATKGRFGLRARGKFNFIIELQTCHLIPPEAFSVAHTLWEKANELGLPDYNMRTHEGFVRYIVVRRSPANTLLIAMLTSKGSYEAEMEQLASIALALPGVQSFHWLLNDGMADTSFGEPLRHWGLETLPMQVGDRTLQIGPNTFFQNNVHLLGQLLDAVRTGVTSASEQPEQLVVADLYGGVGTIALDLAAHVGQISCVEAVEESTVLARQNCQNNGVENISIHHQDVGPYLKTQEPGAFQVAVADPPRTGLGPEVCNELLRIRPERIVYVSCNPLTQVEDLRILTAGYELRSLVGYDMFPHTPHVEAIAVLDRRVEAL